MCLFVVDSLLSAVKAGQTYSSPIHVLNLPILFYRPRLIGKYRQIKNIGKLTGFTVFNHYHFIWRGGFTGLSHLMHNPCIILP